MTDRMSSMKRSLVAVSVSGVLSFFCAGGLNYLRPAWFPLLATMPATFTFYSF